MKVLITGGHFSPALPVIQLLQKKGEDVLVVGRKHTFEGDQALSYEYKTCKELHIPFEHLHTGRLQRTLSKHTIPSLFRFSHGLKDAYTIVRNYKPDVVVTFGGYLSLPIAFAASIQRIPIVIHEQTQKAGLANKIIAKFAKKICITFNTSKQYFPESKTVLTGNPLRKEIFQIEKKIKIPEGKRLYVTGGSSGSHFLNEAIAEIIPQLLEKYVVIHQTGDSTEYNDYDMLQNIKSHLPEKKKNNYIIQKFLAPDEIGWVLKNADLIISRSGVNITLEVLALQKKALFIPLPHGQHNEQLENAQLVKKFGLGEYIEQNDVTSSILLEKIDHVLKNSEGGSKNSEYFIPDAAERIVSVVQSIYEDKTNKASIQKN